MIFTKSISSKIGLILCIPLLLEISIISTSIVLLDQIDQAKIARQKMGTVVFAYVYTLTSSISDYISFVAYASHRKETTREEINSRFERTSQSLEYFRQSCKAAGVPFMDLKKMVMRERSRSYKGRPPNKMSQSLLLELLNGRNVLLDAVGSAKNRLSARTDVLSAREEAERKLITKLNNMLIIALLLSLILTLGLCFLFSKVIIERVAVLRKNTQRLSEGMLLLPPIEGSDEIAKLDATFRSMEQAITAGKIRDDQILSNSIDVICALDRNLHVLKASESCQTLWNLDNQNVVGQSILEFVPDSSRNSTKEYFNVSLGDSSAKVFENECISGVNKATPCLWSVQWSEKDELFICVIHDITERKLAEDRRQTLLAVISHDLRSPLTAAKLCIDMLRIEEKIDSDINTKLTVANDSIDYVIGVTNDLIDLCRFQQAKLSLKLKLSTLDSVLNSISTTFHRQSFLIQIQNDVEVSSYLTIDEEYISRLFMALAKQATMHFEPRAVKLTVRKGPQETIVFGFEPWLEKVTPKDVEPLDSNKKTSFDVTMIFCREIVSNLKGEIVEAAHHKFELHLPNVAVE